MVQWSERLQTLVRGDVWKGEEQSEVKVNESVLQQLVSQGFPENAARVALRKTKNDDFAALLILTCPSDDADASMDLKAGADAEDDSDQAKMQRLLDFFRDLGERYWGWQMESAKRGRGFKGALKENFLPLLPQLRQLAAQPSLAFGTSRAVQYQATCFMNRGLDECPSAVEDRDRDRHRMSLETAPYVVNMVKRIGNLNLQDYKDSLACEMVKETLKLLDNLVPSAVSSRLDESERLECASILIKLVSSFDALMAASEKNAGLPGASGKLSAVELKHAVRALVMFVSSTDASNVQVLHETEQHLEQMGALLSRHDPKLVEGVLSVLAAFLQSFSRLSRADCDQVLGNMMRPGGPLLPLLMHLLATATGKIHCLVVSLVCSTCLLSGRVLRQLLLGVALDHGYSAHGSEALEVLVPPASTVSAADQALLLWCIDHALEQEGKQMRCAGLLQVMDTVLGCIVEGHKAAAAEKDKSCATRASVNVVLADSDHHKRISDMMFEEDVEEMELREMLDADEIRDDDFRSRSLLAGPDRRRAELEIRMQRLRRTKFARLQEAKGRRRYGAEGPGSVDAAGVSSDGPTPGRVTSAITQDLTTGTRVKRGPDWKWHSQDGGPGHQGVVVSGTDKNSDGWVRVQWDKGGVNGYRWGAENSYDVEPVRMSLLSTAVRNKDLNAIREAAKIDDSDINASHTQSLTPLIEAIINAEETEDESDVEIVVALVTEFRADPNLGSAGRLPLHVACERVRPDIVRALLDHNADPMTKDADGLTALDFISRCIEKAPPDGPRGLFSNYGQVLRMLENKVGLTLPIIRRFKFEKEGGQRLFTKGQPGFRYPMPSQLQGNSSFTISLRIRHLDPTGVRVGRACLLSLGRNLDSDKTKESSEKGFTVFLHTRGHLQLGPGLCPAGSCTSVNIAICRARWATLTIVYDKTDATLDVYVDGELKASETVHTNVDLDPTGDILIGTAPEGVDKDDKARFHGTLADIQVHDKPLKDEELVKLHAECDPLPTDAHPSLQNFFCESASRMLLKALSRPMVEANGRHVASAKRQMLAILARVLPFCSGALKSGELQTPLVRVLETLIAEAPSGWQDLRNSDKVPIPMVSLLLCADAIMKIVPASFDKIFRRSGIVARILSLSQNAPHSQSSSWWPHMGSAVVDTHDQYQSVHHAHDLALYIVETHFGGEQGASQVTDIGERVSTALSEIRASLELKRNGMQGSAGIFQENQARQALEQIATLFQNPEGVYCEELLASNLPATLMKFLDSYNSCKDPDAGCALLESVLGGSDSTCNGSDAGCDPAYNGAGCAVLEAVMGGSDQQTPLVKFVTCLRLAIDKMPREALPLVLHEDGAGSDLKALKQWVTIRFEKCKSDKSDLEEIPTGNEVRAEPLSLIKSLRSTLDGMLQSPAASIGRSREDKHGELRAMMQAFGDDPEGPPHSLLEHMRHLVDERSSHDVAPPIQRKFEALPSVHTWDREVAVTGAAKRTLSISLSEKVQAGAHQGTGASNADNNDDNMHDVLEASSATRFEMLRRTSARSAGAARGAHLVASGSKRTIALELYLCFGKQRASSSASRAHEMAAMHEHDMHDHDAQNHDEMHEMQEDQGPAAVSARLSMRADSAKGAYATLAPIPRLSAGSSHRASTAAEGGSAASADCEQGVLVEDCETLFEAMTRLYAVHAKYRTNLRRNNEGKAQISSFVHPGNFWEQNFVVRYKRAASSSRASSSDDVDTTKKEVCVELPKIVMSHVLSRVGGGVRKIERETGAKIKASIYRNETPILRVTGLPDQIDQAVKMIHASAREAPTWRESRDASFLALHRNSGCGQQRASATGATEDVQSASTGSRQAAAEVASSSSQGGLVDPVETSACFDVSETISSQLAFLASSPLRDCLRLLDRLTRRMEGTILRSRSLAVSETLNQYVRKQLDDALVVGSGLVSKLPWMLELCKLHSILSLCVRERFFLAASFGPSRALSTLQSSSDATATDDVEDGLVFARAAAIQAHAMFNLDRPRMFLCPRRPEHQTRVPELVHETVEVDHRRDGHEDKPHLMAWAEEILESHSKSETVLDVTWKGEAGHGSGPTRKFFEKVAALLGSEEENRACNVWRDTEDGNKCGLFPAPLPDDNVARSLVLKRLRLIGLFMGKALQQRQMPGLCLAKPLYKLLIGETVGYGDLKDIDRELAASVENVLEWRRIKDQILVDSSLDDAHRRDRLLAIDKNLCMFENSMEEEVTHKNLDEYARELAEDCVSKMRIDEQIKALREGIDLVFPWQMLCVFSPAELQQKLWSDLEWDESKLEKIVRPGPMWPQDKEQIGWLRQELLNMDTRQRRAFVKFVTASVCMPVEGSPIVVHPQVTSRRDGEDGDCKLPTSRTCTNILYLPAYSSASLLQKRLQQAIWEEHIEFD